MDEMKGEETFPETQEVGKTGKVSLTQLAQ